MVEHINLFEIWLCVKSFFDLAFGVCSVWVLNFLLKLGQFWLFLSKGFGITLFLHGCSQLCTHFLFIYFFHIFSCSDVHFCMQLNSQKWLRQYAVAFHCHLCSPFPMARMLIVWQIFWFEVVCSNLSRPWSIFRLKCAQWKWWRLHFWCFCNLLEPHCILKSCTLFIEHKWAKCLFVTFIEYIKWTRDLGNVLESN